MHVNDVWGFVQNMNVETAQLSEFSKVNTDAKKLLLISL